MTDHATDDLPPEQAELWEAETTRSLLDRLLAESRLYPQSKDYQDLLDFVVRLRNFAPFNAMLLQLQKPGLSYAASAADWDQRFGRRPKEGARPLLILWPFGPVALVYDVVDTEGEPLPRDVESFFYARGEIDAATVQSFAPLLWKKNIGWCWVDAGDALAGRIRVVRRAANDKEATQYRIHVNRNHEPATQFVTVAHELAHLFLGHLGRDRKLGAPERHIPDPDQQELEAESVAYLICKRNGVDSRSYPYLSRFVQNSEAADAVDVYRIMRAAGQVETLLDIAAHTAGFNRTP